MTTTAKRLRIAARHDHSQGRMMNEAADFIEQQQRELEELSAYCDKHKEVIQELDKARVSRIYNDTWTASQYMYRAISLSGFIDQSPQASLAEVRAQAVEGFVSDFMDDNGILHLNPDEYCCHTVLAMANGYANKIRNDKGANQ